MDNNKVRLSDMEQAAREMEAVGDLPLDPEAVRAMQIQAAQAVQPDPTPAPEAPREPAPVIDEGLMSALRGEGLLEDPVQVPAPVQPQPKPVEEPEPGQRIPKDRFDEVLRERDELRRRHDALVQQMLEREAAPHPQGQDGPDGDPLNPEVVEFFDPYLKSRAVTRDEYNDLVGMLHPLLEREKSRRMGEFIAQVVPGFDPANEPLVVERLQSITDERTRAFYSGTAQGAAALAAVMMAEGAFPKSGSGRPAPAERAPTVPMRPMADVSGTRNVSSAQDDQSLAAKLAAMPDEKFAAMRRRMDDDVLSYKPEDLLPR